MGVKSHRYVVELGNLPAYKFHEVLFWVVENKVGNYQALLDKEQDWRLELSAEEATLFTLKWL